MSGPAGGSPSLRPPLHSVGAARTVSCAGGGGGGGLALVLRAAGVRAPRPGAHSAETEKYFIQIFFPFKYFPVPSLGARSFTLFMVI